jgi:hypothetical protein
MILHRHRPQIEKVSKNTRDAVLQKYLAIPAHQANNVFERKMFVKSIH